MRRDERASTSLYAILIVIAICIFAGGALAGFSFFLGIRKKGGIDSRLQADKALHSWIVLYGKSRPSADSRFDEASATLVLEGRPIEVTDLSSRINPNWLDSSMLAQSGFAAFLLPGVSAEGFSAIRRSQGFSMDIRKAYAACFRPEGFDGLLTPYSYADLNTTDPEALVALYAQMARSASVPQAFESRIREEYRITHPVVVAELSDLLPGNASSLFPMLSVAAPYNVNYLPPALLGALLAYPAFGIPDHADRLTRIVTAREGGEVDEAGLRSLLGLPPENPIYRYLGVRTWFWRIKITLDQGYLEAVVGRAPPRPGHELKFDEEVDMEIVKREFLP